jgi:DNA-binding winged helix-turn-helix (wHTH) protein
MRYRFADFMLSPQRRLLVREGREVPLIPRYFDLLLLLIEQRHVAVQRREIFDRVWAGVTVSESALSQAVRTLRRTLDDDPREPRFIRTVSRHGYQFVFPGVIEEADDASWPVGGDAARTGPAGAPVGIRMDADLAAPRWTRAAAGAAIAGLAAGGLGGLILAAAPGSAAPIALAPVLAVIGAACGAIGGAGVGAGLALADTAAYSPRAVALTFGGAIGGGLVGAAVQWLTRWGLASLVGLDIAVGGGPEGLFIGAAAGLGYAIATTHLLTSDGIDGHASSGRAWLAGVVITATLCGLAGLSLTLTGRPLAGGTIHAIAAAADGSQATLAPLGRLIGEPDFGPVTGAILAFGEAAMFGLGLAVGLLRRLR